jgi:hypothetical protein
MRNIIVLFIFISCNYIEKTNENLTIKNENEIIKVDEIDHFSFFKKGMSVSDVHNVLKSQQIKYSNLKSASKVLNDFTFVNDDFEIKNLISYLEINDFIIDNNYFGKVYLFFINKEIYRIAIRHDFYNSESVFKKGPILNNWLNLYLKPVENLVKILEFKYPNYHTFGSTNVDSMMSQSQILFNSGPSRTKEVINKDYHIYFGSNSDENFKNNNLYIEFYQNYYYSKKNNNSFEEHYFHELFVDFKSDSINRIIQEYRNKKSSSDSINKVVDIQKKKKLLDDI